MTVLEDMEVDLPSYMVELLHMTSAPPSAYMTRTHHQTEWVIRHLDNSIYIAII